MADITVNEITLHILDASGAGLILADEPLKDSGEFLSYIENHLKKMLSTDSASQVFFNEEHDNNIEKDVDSLKESHDVNGFGKKLAKQIYACMERNMEDIPSGDLVIASFYDHDTSEEGIALLKLDYDMSYTHDSDHNTTSIKKARYLLPAGNKKINDKLVIYPDSGRMYLTEKVRKIEGTSTPYFSQAFGLKKSMSVDAKIKFISKGIASASAFMDDGINKQVAVKKAMSEQLEDSGCIDMKTVIQDVFDNDTDRESVKSYLEQYHLETTKLQPKAEDTQKKLSTIQITADKDIHINLPMDIYDSSEFEISTAPDGTSEVRLTGILELVVK